MALRRGFKAEANRIALRVRARMGLSTIDPIDPIAICELFDILLLKLSEIRDCDCASFLGPNRSAFSAVTVPCGPKIAIVHNDAHHKHRQNSNICHELAHCFLGHQFAPPLTENGDRSRDGNLEAEASFLAGSLLITNEAAIHIIRNGLFPIAQENYGVSKDMLEYRLKISGAYVIHSRHTRAEGVDSPA